MLRNFFRDQTQVGNQLRGCDRVLLQPLLDPLEQGVQLDDPSGEPTRGRRARLRLRQQGGGAVPLEKHDGDVVRL